MATKSIQFDPAVTADIADIVSTKGTPLIFTQNPAAGTLVPKGVQIEVQTFNPGDIPTGIFDNVHPSVEDILLEDLIDLFENDPFFSGIKGQDTLTAAQRDEFVREVNIKLADKGLEGQITIDDADAVFDSIKGAGDFSSIRSRAPGRGTLPRTGGIGGIGR